jgi:hypothetical protein
MLRSFISDAFEQGAASRQPVEDDVDEPVPERPEPERDGPETHQETGLHAIQGLLGGTLELLAVTTPRPGEVSS